MTLWALQRLAVRSEVWGGAVNNKIFWCVPDYSIWKHLMQQKSWCSYILTDLLIRLLFQTSIPQPCCYQYRHCVLDLTEKVILCLCQFQVGFIPMCESTPQSVLPLGNLDGKRIISCISIVVLVQCNYVTDLSLLLILAAGSFCKSTNTLDQPVLVMLFCNLLQLKTRKYRLLIILFMHIIQVFKPTVEIKLIFFRNHFFNSNLAESWNLIIILY